MNPTPKNELLPIGRPPALVDHDFELLLQEPFASAWETPAPPASLRERLAQRLAASSAVSAPMTTRRHRRLPRMAVAAGVQVQDLYRAASDRALRPGEPLRARLLELASGATVPVQVLDDGAAAGRCHRELLVLSGRVELAGQTLSQRDYHVLPSGQPTPTLHAAEHTLLFWRESALEALPGEAAHTVFDASAGWPELAPGIRRRILWQRGTQAAMLYHAEPGAMLPRHDHGHDEECLMLQGELFLDDVLLQTFDYQLAPAGSEHIVTQTDTGVVIYAHGDIELHFLCM
ncbi:MAG: hypothetical protein RJB37_951 [Pseudomonadota bacterium]|jgi:hypothetical protein